MDHPPPDGADRPGHGEPRVQPDNRDPARWLEDPELETAAERLRRLGGDEELVLALQLAGFSDHTWKPVAGEFARYGVAVFGAWISRAPSSNGWPLRPATAWPHPTVNG